MGIKKFESFTTPESKIKISSTYLPGKPLSIEDVTDEMIDTSLTEYEKLMKTSGKYDPQGHSNYSERSNRLAMIVNLVEVDFNELLHRSIGRNDKEFLKKAVKFLQENS